MLADPLSLPATRPSGYHPLADEPVFDARRHLALEPPAQVWTLRDFGYSEEDARLCASPIAVAGPLRLLSDAGAEAVRTVARALRSERQTSDRTANYLAGGVYRSRFLRDLCSSPKIAAFLSEVARCELLPHAMPSQQVYVNYAPDDLSKAVDTWHTDSIGLDCVLLATDPATFRGGQFQFFRGTREEAAALLEVRAENLTTAIRKDLPEDRVVSMPFAAAGCAVFQQGTMVVHRATRLEQRAERNTVVIGYVARDVTLPDPTRDSIVSWQEPGLMAEFVRHKAWLSRTKLEALTRDLDINASPADLKKRLAEAIADSECALKIVEASHPSDR